MKKAATDIFLKSRVGGSQDLATAVGAHNLILVSKEAPADKVAVALAAGETLGMPVTLLKRNELAATETCIKGQKETVVIHTRAHNGTSFNKTVA